MVREQRARAAQLYKNVVSWSLRFAHITGMPENGWIVDVERCICGCKFYNKFKSCCHILAGRRTRRLGRPGANDYSEKLFNRQVQKREKPSSKRQRTQPPTTPSSSGTEIPLVSPPAGRTPNASRALDVQFLLRPDT
ncbi:hypothetical protein PC116_g17595 [Phytophthora cactorum]|uniref:Uncharacterized protein n=1 Tax=Phytophthora cactorum TaxID=29920 RepID=A0A8T1KIM0_9STRA|nr:hypothetical protein Pcac1_g6357 [Phytophthora cactorum]KAG2917741.1 hypothetical protein PC114_g7017 [Phytophthora cactorum]KAG2947239.1 hypothetical protein PC117_g6959 [Phytophthora cactorum]KAG3007739.1 hypothetical protein PC119_g14466 [Phytophthora cactorum]KAG3018311.1 hypothetical protein PC120_g10510 [Phytophthora cactorum]